MRLWIIAAVTLAACASGEPSSAPAHQSATAQGRPSYEDARSVASDEAIRASRRAYRNACLQTLSADHCECLTASMAQSLAPPDLDAAAARLRGGAVSGESAARIAPAQAQAEAACAQYRRS